MSVGVRVSVRLPNSLFFGLILSHQVCYNEFGNLYLDKLNKYTLTRNLVHRLERLGYTVTLEQKAAWSPCLYPIPAAS